MKLIPCSSKELSKIIGLNESEFELLPAQKKIKKIIKEYNLFKREDLALKDFELLKVQYSDEMSSEAITKLVAYIKLR